jgi:DNA-binding LacI/PurR family transcriptional regulator
MSVTIKDIAQAAQVSHTTVSRALHDHPAIAPTTVERIKRLAHEMGYMPSAVARGLKTRRSHALGVILSHIDDPFFSEVLQGIESVVQAAGYSLFVAASHRRLENETAIVRAMAERRVDGVIVCSTPFSQVHSRQLETLGLPVVAIHNQSPEDYPYTVYHDDRAGSYRLALHLLAAGHRRIAYLGSQASPRTSYNRRLGLLDALQAAGLAPSSEDLRDQADGRPEDGAAGVEELLRLPQLPTAIMCYNDMLAVGVLSALAQQGVRVPDDVSVTGFDNISISAYLNPPLTTFDQPKYPAGSEAARIMLRLLDSNPSADAPPAPAQVFLLGSLLPRASTGPPRQP